MAEQKLPDKAQENEMKREKVRVVPIKYIDDSPDHPFQVRDDEEMMSLVESIATFGVITPVIARKTADERYELISGHRRKRACELLHIDTLPIIVRDTGKIHNHFCLNSVSFTDGKRYYDQKATYYKMREVSDDLCEDYGLSVIENPRRGSKQYKAWLYDMDYMIRREYLSEDTLDLYRRCVVFYLAVATETPMMTVDYTAVEQITPHRIMTDLKPVIRDRDTFELDDAKRRVEAFLDKNLYLTENDLYFLRSFRLGRYKPENLFSDERVLERIADHPMALWKTQRNRDKGER